MILSHYEALSGVLRRTYLRWHRKLDGGNSRASYTVMKEQLFSAIAGR